MRSEGVRAYFGGFGRSIVRIALDGHSAPNPGPLGIMVPITGIDQRSTPTKWEMTEMSKGQTRLEVTVQGEPETVTGAMLLSDYVAMEGRSVVIDNARLNPDYVVWVRNQQMKQEAK